MKTVLIVEDEFRIRQGLGNLINKVNLGCQVVGEAENGYEGLLLIRKTEPDIVITDIKMPKIDGLMMIQKAKEMGAGSTFVILSGYADFEYARQGILLAVKDYLLKPVTITDVKQLLLKFIEEEAVPEETGGEYSALVKDMLRFISGNYGMRLSLDTFAEKYRLTPEYISTMFAKEMEITFSNYLKKVRIEKAIELILETDMKIYEVGCSVGYPDQKYFSKVFKEYTGISAKQFALKKEMD